MQHIPPLHPGEGYVCRGCQGLNGVPHLAYYDVEHRLSFVWDGHAPCAEVSDDGYGGEARWLMPVGERHRDLATFERACRGWATDLCRCSRGTWHRQ